jgi:alpha-galactosidase
MHGHIPEIVYWGTQLSRDVDERELHRAIERPIPQGLLDVGETLCLVPQSGRGFTGHPAVQVHRGCYDSITNFSLTEHRTDDSQMTLVLNDADLAATLYLEFSLDQKSGVLTCRVKLKNTGNDGLQIDWLAGLTLPTEFADFIFFEGRWALEFQPARQYLHSGQIVKENRTGRTSHHCPPFLIAGERGFGENHGKVVALHLAWSGNHKLFAERLRDGRIQLQCGALLAPGEIILKSGDSWESPPVYVARGTCGLNEITRKLHSFVRKNILPPRITKKPRPIHFNTWEAVYFQHDMATLRKLVELAADVGAERFVLDDGWFKGRISDSVGLGDWEVDGTKYPDGLKPLIDQVIASGMEFGLWVEPEMANSNSDLLRAHPDWVLGLKDRPQPLGRSQYILDLTQPEVANTIFEKIDALLLEHPISYLKWDANRDISHGVSGGRPAVFAQVQALYGLIDRIRSAHPDLEIESCASGGARADYAMLTRAERIWTSDCNDPYDRQIIQRGFSIFFPPEVIGCHFGPPRAHTTGREASAAFRAYTAFFGHMGIEANLLNLTIYERRKLASVIGEHKRWRDHLHRAQIIRLEHDDSAICAFAAIDRDTALVSVAHLASSSFPLLAPLRMFGLKSGNWSVRQLNVAHEFKSRMKYAPALARGEAVILPEPVLREYGIPLPAMSVGEAALFVLTRASSGND